MLPLPQNASHGASAAVRRRFDVSKAELASVHIVDPTCRRTLSLAERRALMELELSKQRARSFFVRIPFVSCIVLIDLCIWGYVALVILPKLF